MTDNSEDHIDAKQLAFECNICMVVATNPVVTPCGHLFWLKLVYSVGHASIIGSGPIRSFLPVQSARVG